MIKLNGKKYYCCTEIVSAALDEISNVFDQYTQFSTPYPPVKGILQLTDEQRDQICLIKTNLKNKIEKYYCDSNETCCKTDIILEFLKSCKHCDSDTINYDKYKKSIENKSDCEQIKSEFCKFLENTCIDIAASTMSKM